MGRPDDQLVMLMPIGTFARASRLVDEDSLLTEIHFPLGNSPLGESPVGESPLGASSIEASER